MFSPERWKETWRHFGLSITPGLAREFEELMLRYSESHRRYHTTRHLDECFEKLSEIRSSAEHLGEVELALWYHDAIYEKRSNQNEAKSAELAVNKSRAAGLAPETCNRIASLILATRHAVVPQSADEKVLVDVDLSILGVENARFDEYEKQVREEYSWVPGFLFKRERRKILKEFLDRPTIFSTQAFYERYEAKARANLARSLERLGS